MIGPDLGYKYLGKDINNPDYNPFGYLPDHPEHERLYGNGNLYTSGNGNAMDMKTYTYATRPDQDGRLAREVSGQYTMLPPAPSLPPGAQYGYGSGFLGWEPGALLQNVQKNIMLTVGAIGLVIILISVLAIIFVAKK